MDDLSDRNFFFLFWLASKGLLDKFLANYWKTDWVEMELKGNAVWSEKLDRDNWGGRGIPPWWNLVAMGIAWESSAEGHNFWSEVDKELKKDLIDWGHE